MPFQEHKTEKGKMMRRGKYQRLIDSGQSADRSRRFRDWTWNKVRMIINKECEPI